MDIRKRLKLLPTPPPKREAREVRLAKLISQGRIVKPPKSQEEVKQDDARRPTWSTAADEPHIQVGEAHTSVDPTAAE